MGFKQPNGHCKKDIQTDAAALGVKVSLTFLFLGGLPTLKDQQCDS